MLPAHKILASDDYTTAADIALETSCCMDSQSIGIDPDLEHRRSLIDLQSFVGRMHLGLKRPSSHGSLRSYWRNGLRSAGKGDTM